MSSWVPKKNPGSAISISYNISGFYYFFWSGVVSLIVTMQRCVHFKGKVLQNFLKELQYSHITGRRLMYV